MNRRDLTPEPAAILREAARDKDLGFQVTASWADVRRKAKRIRAEGGVTIVVASNDGIGGQVKGDRHTYEAILVFKQASRRVIDWTCGCAWAAWAFDRSPAFKRFEGRMCSHALALQFEAQSQGMFGKEIHESEPPKKVPTVVKYDPDDGRSVFARPYEGSLAAVAVARLRAEEADPAEVIGTLIQTGLKHTAARDLWKSAHEHEAKTARVYWHGTDHDLDDQSHLLPPSSTGQVPNHHDDEGDRDRIFMTDSPEEARQHGEHVYEVSPHHEPDEDDEHVFSTDGPVRIVRKHARDDEPREGRHAAAFQTGLDLVDAGELGPVLAAENENGGYYHVAPSAVRDKIEEHGIDYARGRASGHSEYAHEDLPPGNYLFNNADHARAYRDSRAYPAEMWSASPEHIRAEHGLQQDPFHDPTTGFGLSSHFTMDPIGSEHLHRTAVSKDEVPGPKVSGVALKAHDTGRVLMLQRGLEDEKDPAAGAWEFPGGHHEDGDLTSLHAGIREWQEEVGQPFPDNGVVKHTWTSPDGVYQGHVVVVPSEKDLSMKDGRVLPNPDDPKGDHHEQAAWWSVEHAKKNPALRAEVKAHTPWREIEKASLDASKKEARSAGPMGDESRMASGLTHEGSSWDPISNTTVTQPGRNLSEPEHSTSKNPASTGFAASEDPSNWDNVDTGPVSGSVVPSMSFDSTLHERPEPALPSTDGTAEYHPEIGFEDLDPVPDDPAQPDPYETNGTIAPTDGSLVPNTYHSSLGERTVADIVAEFQKSAAAQELMAPEAGGSDDIAAAARAHLGKTALADFSPEEQRELINENPDARARNFADLKLAGSHYHLLEEAMANGDVDPSALFL